MRSVSVTPKPPMTTRLVTDVYRVGSFNWREMVSLPGGGYLGLRKDSNSQQSLIYKVNLPTSSISIFAGKSDANRKNGNGRVETTALGKCLNFYRNRDSIYIGGHRVIYVCSLVPCHGTYFLNTLTFCHNGGDKDGSIIDDTVSYRYISQITGYGQTIYMNDNDMIRVLKEDGSVVTLKKMTKTVSFIVALSNGYVCVCSGDRNRGSSISLVSDSGDNYFHIAGNDTRGAMDGDASLSTFTCVTGMLADAANCVYLTDVLEEGGTAIRIIDTEKHFTTTLQICPEIVKGRLLCFTEEGHLMIAEQDEHEDNEGKIYIVKTACSIPGNLKTQDSDITSKNDLVKQGQFENTLAGKMFHDVTFEFDDGPLYAHKFKLMEYEYFAAMFANPLLSAGIGTNAQNKYETSREAFQEVLRYIYTGSLTLDRDIVFDIIALANFLMIEPVKEECVRFFMSDITGDVEALVQCYISVMRFDKFSCIRELLHKEVCKNFREIELNDALIDMLGNNNLLAGVIKGLTKRARV